MDNMFYVNCMKFCARLQSLLEDSGIDPEEVNSDPDKFRQIVKVLIKNDGCLNPPEIRGWFKHLMDGELNGRITFDHFATILVQKLLQIEAVKMMSKITMSYGYKKVVEDQNHSSLPFQHQPKRKPIMNPVPAPALKRVKEDPKNRDKAKQN